MTAPRKPKPLPTPAVDAAPILPEVPAVAEVPEAKKVRPSKPASERRNEFTHPDGRSAVLSGACPQCKARKGEKCFAKDGARTNYVHSPRMKAWEAKGSPVIEAPDAAPAPGTVKTTGRRGAAASKAVATKSAKATKARTLRAVK